MSLKLDSGIVWIFLLFSNAIFLFEISITWVLEILSCQPLSKKTNDLAILKIFDINFDSLDDLPYNFKSRSSDVGTKVYAFGYPMALSVMGKEIKITDGIISSKSGYDGDINKTKE